MAFDLGQLDLPVVQAPMAGGPSTPALAAAVCEAGGLGFLAAGYKSAEAVAADMQALRERTDRPFGVNIFVPSDDETPPAPISAYAQSLEGEAERYGVELGEPLLDDDAFDAKLELVLREGVDVVSFTFGCPAPAEVRRLHAEDIAVWVTVTSPAEAHQAETAGADALVVQGTEAGGHRGYFRDDPDNEEYGLLVLLRLLAAQTSLPLIATGGIMDGAALAAVLCAGASAAQLGSALMLTPEAGTAVPHREQLERAAPTRLTRAFSGRRARGIVNRFMNEHDAQAPSAYPEVHHLTSPIRAAAREAGDAQAINLWAGQGHELARQVRVGELLRQLISEAALTVRREADRLSSGSGSDSG
jgi:nitronate monooxygenase